MKKRRAIESSIFIGFWLVAMQDKVKLNIYH
jgi:hypothetical protein